MKENPGLGSLSEIHVAATPAEAWRKAQDLATPSDLICVTGSFFIAAEIRQLWANASTLVEQAENKVGSQQATSQ